MEIELTVLNSLKIYQPKNGYRFSSEPFVLMKEIKLNNNSVFLDYGSGCGIVSILASKLNKKCSIFSVEKNPDMIELIKKNIELHNIENIKIVDNIKQIGTNRVDIIVSNPPYFTENSYRKSHKFYNEKFESTTPDEMLNEIKRVIKNKGLFKISYHSTRFSEIICKLEKFGFGIKNIIPVYGNRKKDASFLIVESKFGTKSHSILKKAIYLEEFQYF